MGVLGLFSFLYDNFNYKDIFTTKEQKNIIGFFIDMNSLIHKVAQEVFAYGDDYKDIYSDEEVEYYKANPKKLYQKFYNELDRQLKALFDQSKPRTYFMVSVDGVPPFAKMIQQRSRRYKSKPANEDRFGFTNVMISPGTKFMDDLSKVIIKSVNDIKNNNKNVTVVYSSHRQPGEGEHKIMNKIRELSNERAKWVIYSNDADLIVLGMQKYTKATIIREFSPSDKRIYGIKSDYLYIDSYRLGAQIRRRYNLTSNEDFLIISLLLGNDFLHQLPYMDDFRFSIKFILNIIKNERFKNLSLSTNKGINWQNFRSLMQLISNNMGRFYKRKVDIIKSSKTRSYTNIQNSILKYSEKTSETELIEDVDNITVGNKIKKKVNKKERFKKKEEEIFDFDSYRFFYYGKVFKIYGIKFSTKEIRDKYTTDKNIKEICTSWIEGVEWVYKYYIYGDKDLNKDWTYKYHYSPFIEDILDVSEITDIDEIKSKISEKVTPKFEGMKIVFGNFIDRDWKRKVIKFGGTIQSYVTDDVDIIIRKDDMSLTNRKIDKGLELGIEIFTKHEFNKRFNT